MNTENITSAIIRTILASTTIVLFIATIAVIVNFMKDPVFINAAYAFFSMEATLLSAVITYYLMFKHNKNETNNR